MEKSPGHQKWPEHKVQEEKLDRRVQVEVNGDIVASSTNVIKLQEDKHPDRYYFPRADVNMELLQRTQTTSQCPFKGDANYYTLQAGGERLEDAVWTYEDPYEEHSDLKDRLAFYDDKHPAIALKLPAS